MTVPMGRTENGLTGRVGLMNCHPYFHGNFYLQGCLLVRREMDGLVMNATAPSIINAPTALPIINPALREHYGIQTQNTAIGQLMWIPQSADLSNIPDLSPINMNTWIGN